MAILTMDDVVAALPGKSLNYYKNSAVSKGAGFLHSLWSVAGNPGVGATPPTGVGEVPTSLSAGALFFGNAAGGDLSYLSKLSYSCASVSSLILYDRLVHTSGLVGNSTGVQNINTPALTRHTDGIGVEIWLETYTPTGSTQANITVNYTNQDNVAKTITLAYVTSPVSGQIFVVPLASGDYGVKSVQSVQFSISTGVAGNFGVTLAKRKVEVPQMIANSGNIVDMLTSGFPTFEDSACVALAQFCSSTATGVMLGSATILQG